MQIPVLVEPIANNGYCAKSGEPLSLSAKGATREEAVAKLRALMEQQLRQNKQLVAVEVPADIGPAPHPWMQFAGMFKDDPDFKDVLEIMAENRRKMDEDPDIL